jgi:hypothetical protein
VQPRRPTEAPVLHPAPTTPTGAPNAPGEGGPNFGSEVTTPTNTMGCQQAQRTFEPKVQTVFLVVDRSNSMFDPNPPGAKPPTTSWGLLRSGVLQVLGDLEGVVRFGFGAFSSRPGITYAALPEAQAMNECVDMPSVPPQESNATAIANLYNSLNMAMDKNTPTVLALRRAARTLWADTTEGDKYILFVTDGEPDFCDDGNALCPPDSVVGKLQELAAGIDENGQTRTPIHTLVFGLQSPLTSVLPQTLQNFANAGAGLPVSPPQRANQAYNPNAVYDECNGVAGWKADFDLTGKQTAGLTQDQLRRLTIGSYIDPADPLQVPGSATVYRPDPTDQAALIGQISQALAGVKSCSFDLTGDVLVDLNRADLGQLAKIIVNGKQIPFDPVNGWHMESATTVALEGAACADWRVPGETSIDFDFPCDVIIVR